LLDPGDGILRPAMKIDVFPNPLGSISNGISPFNEAGQLAFRVTFADQSQGIFVASPDVGAVPEPGWGGVAILVTGGLMFRRRRRVDEVAKI
jgi:LPXTG-motif cell wall-anchored protein